MSPATLSKPSTIFITKYCFTCDTSLLPGRRRRSKPSPSRFWRLFLLIDVHILGVDHALVFLFLARAGIRAGLGFGARSSLRSLRRLVHGLRKLVRGLGQALTGRVHDARIRALDGFLRVRQSRFHRGLLVARDLVPMLLQHLLDVVDEAVELVAGFDLFALGLVFGGVRLGFLGHALYLFLAQTRRRCDRDLLIL